MIELCKSESEDEDVLENKNETDMTQNDNSTSNFETTQNCTQNQDIISSENHILSYNLCKVNNETEINDHIDSNIQEQNCSNGDLTNYDNNLKEIDNSDHEIVKEIDVSKTVADENNSQLKTLTNNEFHNDLPQEGIINTSAEISLVYNDSIEENEAYVNLESETHETNDDNVEHHMISQDHLNNDVTGKNSELNKPDDGHLIFNDTEKQISTKVVTVDCEKPFMREINQSDEHAFSDDDCDDDDDVNMAEIDKLIENAEIIQSMYLVHSSTCNCLLCNIV